jgi:hypothetical protein
MDGWQHYKALITLGTPHRGAVNAAETLGNGISKLGLDISQTLRSLPSMYQILPIYPVIDRGTEVVRLSNTDVVPNLSRSKAAEGTKFLLDIADAVERNTGLLEYALNGYQMIPVVGTRQPTNQSLRVAGGRLEPMRTSTIMDPALTHGDGTVPFVSAIPIEMSETYRDSFFTVTHGAIQNSPVVLEHLSGLLTRMQLSLAQFKGVPSPKDPSLETALSLDVPDFVEAGNPLNIEAAAYNADDSVALSAHIQPLSNTEPSQNIPLVREEDNWHAVVDALNPGYYRLTVSGNSPNIIPVSDLFVVA